MPFYPESFPTAQLDTIVPSDLFLWCAVAMAVVLVAREYSRLLRFLTTTYPKCTLALFVLGAWAFVYILASMALELGETLPANEPVLQLLRSCLILGSRTPVTIR